jgi:hypothetical protein
MTSFEWRHDAGPGQPEGPDSDLGSDSDSFVRPFIVTGGRTRPTDGQLRVETLISATPAALSTPLRFEHRRIVEMSKFPISVAEVAAHLRVPIGVARILIADLIGEQLVTVHEQLSSGSSSLSLLERIREGVRAL